MHKLVKASELHFKPMRGRADCVEAKQPFADTRLKIDANRAHIADDLRGRFLECEVKSFFAAFARGDGEMCSETGFAGPRRTCDKHTAAPEKTLAAEHSIESWDASGDA